MRVQQAISVLVLFSIAFAACGVHETGGVRETGSGSILLFNGSGTSPGDVMAVESVLRGNDLTYSTANSFQFNEMDESQLRKYRLLIIPGGNFIDIGKNLSADATTAIRRAVQNGLNYLGICAGGFFAGDTGFNSLNLTSGVKFGFYSSEARGIRKAAFLIAVARGPMLDQYWEDGPQFTGWGAVVAKYPDGTPAVVQGSFGSGWVLLSGVHPEAPAAWRRGIQFRTSVREDNDYAATLIQAALNGTRLSQF